MLRASQITLAVNHTEEDLLKEISRRAGGVRPREIRIVRRSLDARKKPDLFFSYTVDASFDNEKQILTKKKRYFNPSDHTRYRLFNQDSREFPATDSDLGQRPVIVGTGPAGLFAGLALARAGMCPLLLERGDPVEERKRVVDYFLEKGQLDPESNVQFGEGGAGTFSDGKLNTMVKDRTGRNRFVLEELVRYGAPEDILYEAKPHIGTDILSGVTSSIRKDIEKMGGRVCFRTRLEDLIIRDGRLEGILLVQKGERREIPCKKLILAPGHSARDTFSTLYERGLVIRQKAFAIGVRVEHPADMIERSQYGLTREEALAGNPACGWDRLPAASYKLTHKCKNGRGIYTFCMCPGGYVINSSSEEKRLCVNGMSQHKRDARNSNSAVITTVGPEDFGSSHPLAGLEYQRKYESMAWFLGRGKVPVQLLGDFLVGRTSVGVGDIEPSVRGGWAFGNLNLCLPDYVCESLTEGMKAFGRKIKGFDRPDTILCGVETRTSSPIRIERGEDCQSNIKGIYPCGEGAGYAGGIMSAAMDGLKCAEALLR